MDPKEGDIHGILAIGRLERKLKRDVFKAKYRQLWKSAQDRDRFLAINSFLSLSCNNTLAAFCTDLSVAIERIVFFI